jgi:hypothetical protein
VLEAESMDQAASFMAKHPSAVLGRILILPTIELPWDREE